MPPGLQPLAFAPSRGPARATAVRSALTDGGVAEILVFLQTTPAQAGQTFVNLARAAAMEFDPNLANNQDDATITLTNAPVEEANVVVTKRADKPIVTVGDVVTFTVTAENQGPGTASNVMLSDGANPAIEILSAEPSQGSCVIAKPSTCELGALAPGARATLVVRARVVAAGVLRNVAAVIFPGSDPNPMDSLTLACRGPGGRSPAQAREPMRGALRRARDLHLDRRGTRGDRDRERSGLRSDAGTAVGDQHGRRAAARRPRVLAAGTSGAGAPPDGAHGHSRGERVPLDPGAQRRAPDR